MEKVTHISSRVETFTHHSKRENLTKFDVEFRLRHSSVLYIRLNGMAEILILQDSVISLSQTFCFRNEITDFIDMINGRL